jgi:hypothetical protein
MQRSERLLSPTGEAPKWVPRPPLRYRKVNRAWAHLMAHIGGTWDLDRGDIDAIMFLRAFEDGLAESMPRWEVQGNVWKNVGL